MRLSEWRKAGTRYRDSVGSKVSAVVDPILLTMGTERDPHCWLAWGDDPTSRYQILVPTAPGLVVVHVRVNVPGEGPRASAKLVRWSKVQVGELAVETAGGHRLLTFQVEQQMMQGADEIADAIARLALILIAAIDGRPWPPFDPPPGRRGSARAVASRATARSGGRPAARSAGAKKAAAGPKSAPKPSPAPKRSAAPKALGPGR